jgi:hypothetical protein
VRGNSLFSAGRTSTSLGTSGTRIGSLHLEHYSVAISAARQRCAVEIANNIDDHTSVGFRSVRALRAEAMQHLLCPAPARCGRQLEHRPVVQVSAARDGRAVEIAGGIEDQPGEGLIPVRAVAEAPQHLLRPGSARCGRQLEHRPVSVSAARRRSCRRDCRRHRRSGRQAGGPVCAVAEAIQHRLRPAPARCGRQLEHRPVP